MLAELNPMTKTEPHPLELVANKFGLTIDNRDKLFHYARDVDTAAPLKAYRPYVLEAMTADEFETDLENALERYEPPNEEWIAAEQEARKRRRGVLGRFKRMEAQS